MARKRFLIIALLLLLATVISANEQVHTLQRGETLYTLARRYNVTVDQLIRHNSIADPTRLAVGAPIRIPGTYVVQQGEYIFSIARTLGVDWLELLAVNNIARDDIVRPGDVLVLPGGARGASPPQAAEASSRPDDAPAMPPREPEPEPGPRPDAVVPVASARPPVLERLPNWPHPGERSQWDGKFPGVVMRGAVGDEFRSVTRGVVEYVGPFSSFGKLVLVRGENGYLYGYAGADRILVTKGERLEPGTVIGTVGFSPAFDSAMVLFTVWRNNRYVDPETAPRG